MSTALLRFALLVCLCGSVTALANTYTVTNTAGGAIPSTSPVGEVSTPKTAAATTGGSWTEVMIEFERAKVRHDFDRMIELMSRLMLQRLSKEQVAIALTNRGAAHADKHETDKAMEDFDQALRIDPRYPLAYGARATLWAQKGDLQEAIRDFDEIIALKPSMAKPYQTRGAIHGRLHQYDQARADFDKAIQLNPKSAEAYAMRGSVWLGQGENQKALDDAGRAEAIDPALQDIYAVRVRAYVRTNRLSEAQRQLSILASLKSKEPAKPLNSIAWTRATCPDQRMRDGKEAVKVATKACELSHWKNPHTLDTLAASYAETGDFDSAVKYEQQAIDLAAPAMEEKIPEMNDRLALYRRHEPYRDKENF